ncbi:hypothetical protein CARUB_v10019122mg [Capsella rubella]|uniref:Uncharacterized protein n=1 Tax=Capsella rubella TaxID=81985 RepID=R0FTG3_9BRAS|nr:hypothetical protein CARUB_v10019122mg [Capsella rubella]
MSKPKPEILRNSLRISTRNFRFLLQNSSFIGFGTNRGTQMRQFPMGLDRRNSSAGDKKRWSACFCGPLRSNPSTF